jgi:hypothetical protein
MGRRFEPSGSEIDGYNPKIQVMVSVPKKIECAMGSPLEREICKGRTLINLDNNENSLAPQSRICL